MTARRGKVDLDATRTQLETAGHNHAAERLAELVETAAKQELSAHGLLDRLLGVELGEREERRIKTSLRLSGLLPGQTLGNFDFSFQPTIGEEHGSRPWPPRPGCCSEAGAAPASERPEAELPES